MPVKSKRNVHNKKQRYESAPAMYTNDQFEDTPSTSATSSPPEHAPVIGSPAFAAVYDPGPPVVHDEVREHVIEEYLEPYEEEQRYEVEEEPILPVPPPGTVPYSPPLRARMPPDETYEAKPDLLVDVDVPEPRERGHVRSPVLAREPSTLESFSRTIRGYVPSSIPIPTAAPTPPRVSRPLSFGSFLSPTRTDSSSRSRGETTKRRGSDVDADKRAAFRAQQPTIPDADAVFSLDEEVMPEVEGNSATRYPSTARDEDIVWSRWDSIADGSAAPRVVLVVGYRTGIQIWDCSNLGSISEILNLSGPSWADIKTAAVLPNPDINVAPDGMERHRPLIGVIRSATPETSEFLVYSLKSHQVIETVKLPSLVSMNASREFIVLSAAQPPALHILSSRTFATLYHIPSSSLVTFAHPAPTHLQETNNAVSPSRLDELTHVPHSSQLTAIPQPTYTLSNRLLAYVSPPPRLDSPHEVPSRTPRSASRLPSEDNTLKFPLTQAELGTAASKLGVSVFSGMKVLGGIAYSAARAGVTAAATAAERRYSAEVGAPPVVPGKFFSRSAPAAGSRDEQRDAQQARDVPPEQNSTPTSPVVDRQPVSEDHHHITVVDLGPLRLSADASPTVVAEFLVGKEQPVSVLQFSQDGTSLMVATSGGQTMRTYQLRPSPLKAHRYAPKSASNDTTHLKSPVHVYDLRRGRTSAVVDGLVWAHDGRWMAVATEKGTVHVFATNPYGGPSDEQSHLGGRVVNPKEVQPLSTEAHAVIRLRVPRLQSMEGAPVPLAFTFLQQSTPLPSTLAPQDNSYQDTLLFNPREGSLSLRRIHLSKHMRDRLPSGLSSVPVVNALGRLGTSAPTELMHAPSGLSRMMARSSEVVATENVVATWMLRRSKDWKEIRRSLRTPQTRKRPNRVAKPDWLSQAELSTHSRSTRIVPRSIYLSHQFSFCFLGEDYHGLLRSHNFDVPVTKIDVRRQIEVSASGSSMSESFVSGSSLPSQSGFASSFDEPLASALTGDMRQLNPSPPVIPMYPNGPPSRSYRNPIPIRHVAVGISDGMTEGLGRLRREIGKVRSPRLAPKRDSLSMSVPLEFDEEDEDFAPPACTSADDREDVRSRTTEAASLSTPSTGLEPLPGDESEDGAWDGWGPEEKEAVEEIEQFDDIAVGFMDEELARPTRRR